MRLLLPLVLALALCGFDWGTLPGELERTPVDANGSSDGKRVFFEVRRVKGRAEDVLSHCLGQFRRQGLYVPKLSRQLQGPGPSLTALDVEARTSYSVAVLEKGDGMLEVILGGAEHRSRMAGIAWPPVHPAAQSPVRSTTEGAQSVTFRCAAPRGELERWYADELAKAGFTAVQGGWEKSGQRVSVHVSGASVTVLAESRGPLSQ